MKKYLLIFATILILGIAYQAQAFSIKNFIFGNKYGDTIGTLPQWSASTTIQRLIPRNTSYNVRVPALATTSPTNNFVGVDSSGNFLLQAGGGSGTPGGSSGQLQYNNAGSFAGLATGTAGTVLAASSTSATGYEWKAAGGSGTVTSVDMTVPTGLSVSGNPITTSGTLALALQGGYEIPKTASTTEWATAYGWGNHASAGYLTSSALTPYLTTTSAASTYEPILTKGNLTANSPLSFNNTRQVIGGATAISLDTSGTWTGNAGTASALAANGSNCTSGNAPLGVDASGTVESCFDVWTEAENTSADYLQSADLANYVQFSYASSSYATKWNLIAGSNITLSTSSGVSIAVSSSPSFSSATITNSSSTNSTVATNAYFSNIASCSNGLVTGAGGLVACNGSAFLTAAVTSLNGLTGVSQTFATSTTATGLTQTITSAGTVHTWNLSLTSGYGIPLTASSTNWNTFYDTPSNRIAAGTNLAWSGNTLNGTMASSTIIAGGTATHSPSITFASTTDTNILLNVVCSSSTCTFNPSWTGTLADARITSSSNWNTAYTDRLKWDGGSTGLTAATGRTSLGLGTMALEANTGSTTITTLGTIGTGTWNGTTIAIGNGGTGQTTATLAFNALDPMTTKGDIITHNGTDSVRLAVGTDNYVLTASSTATNGIAWQASPPASLSGGTAGFVAHWDSATAISPGKLMDNGTVLGMNATSSTIGFNIQGAAGTNAIANFASSTGTSVLQITAGSQVLVGTTARLTIPQGSAPTLSAVGDIAVDTSNGGLLSFYSTGRENLNATTTKGMVIENPTASESLTFFQTDVPITITKVTCQITSSVSNVPSWTFSLPHSTSRATASANAMSSGQACTSTTTPQSITIGGDLTLAANEVIWATSSAVSNASTTLIQVYFKYDN